MPDPVNFLSRWSRRKIETRATGRAPPEAPATGAPLAATLPTAPAGAAPLPPVDAAPLPPVESLTPQSDFAPFMAAEVDADVRRSALKTLFSDPRFNTMDMLDVYVDDYSKPDPLPEGWLAKLEQMSSLGDKAARDKEAERRLVEEGVQPQTQVAASGFSPPEPGSPEASSAGPEPEQEPEPATEPSARDGAPNSTKRLGDSRG